MQKKEGRVLLTKMGYNVSLISDAGIEDIMREVARPHAGDANPKMVGLVESWLGGSNHNDKPIQELLKPAVDKTVAELESYTPKGDVFRSDVEEEGLQTHSQIPRSPPWEGVPTTPLTKLRDRLGDKIVQFVIKEQDELMELALGATYYVLPKELWGGEEAEELFRRVYETYKAYAESQH